jgi:hypothetical protein
MMTTITEDMKETADYAIKSAQDRYQKDLDFSEQSLPILENILTKISWEFSGTLEKAGEGGLAYNQALIWGSYLGEYMISKWGGKWIQRDSDRLISINHILFFPIKFVHQKITAHPEYNVEDYIKEVRKMIDTSAINPQEAQFEITKSARFNERLAAESSPKPFRINRRSILMAAGMIGAVAIIAGVIAGFWASSSGGQSAFGLMGQETRTDTPTESIPSETQRPTDTPLSTATPLPTSTPLPTQTSTPVLVQISTATDPHQYRSPHPASHLNTCATHPTASTPHGSTGSDRILRGKSSHRSQRHQSKNNLYRSFLRARVPVHCKQRCALPRAEWMYWSR